MASGYGYPDGLDGPDGVSGFGPVSGSYGGAGISGFGASYLNAGSGTGSISTTDSIIYVHDTDLVKAEGDGGGATTFTFNINRLGDLSEDVSVDWAFVPGAGITPDDFSPSAMAPTGTVTFTAYTDVTQMVTFDVAGDYFKEADETFTIQLSNLTDIAGGATQGLGTSSVSGTILDDDVAYENWGGPNRTGSLWTSGDDAQTVANGMYDNEFLHVTNSDYFGGAQEVFTINADNSTLEADAPYDALITLGNLVTTFTIDGDTSADVNGNSNNNVINGGAGDNTFLGGMGNDTLNGGDGNDDLQGGSDNDYLDGYWGDDTMVGGSGDDTMLGNLGKDDMFGSTGADSMNGGLGADTLDGGGQNDTINAGDSNDSVDGGGGDDLLNGQNQKDTINGGTGDDTLNGANGGDVLNLSLIHI